MVTVEVMRLHNGTEKNKKIYYSVISVCLLICAAVSRELAREEDGILLETILQFSRHLIHAASGTEVPGICDYYRCVPGKERYLSDAGKSNAGYRRDTQCVWTFLTEYDGSFIKR